MSWITPLGLPVVQPYRRETGMLVKTLIQSVVRALVLGCWLMLQR